jgi:phage head maturation protease
MNRKDQSVAVKYRSFDYDVKAVSDDGLFSGYGSVFGVIDSYNEVVAPGAFLDSIADLKAKSRSLPVLWQHRTAEPIGSWSMDTLKEDTKGLFGDGELWLADAPYARIDFHRDCAGQWLPYRTSFLSG